MNLSFTICDDNKEYIEDIKNTIEQLDDSHSVQVSSFTTATELLEKLSEAKADRYLLKPISLEVAEVAVSI